MNTPDDGSDITADLLDRWRGGDRNARNDLLAIIQPWLHGQMSKALSGRSRSARDSMDLAQTAVVNFLDWGPKFVPANAGQLRGLLLRIAKNELVDQERRLARSGGGRHLDSRADTVLSGFGGIHPTSQGPSSAAVRTEEREWVRLALQFLETDERLLLLASEVEGLDWPTIANMIGAASPDAARMQCVRLKPRVARLLIQLRGGRLPSDRQDAGGDG